MITDPQRLRTYECDGLASHRVIPAVVVLPETNCSNAATAAEHLREQVAAAPFEIASASIAVTASFGVSGWKDLVPAGATLDALMAKCDERVYASKAGGRNKVSVESMD